MQTLLQIIRLLYKRRYWLLIVPLLTAAVLAAILSRNPDTYKSSTTIYTGIVSGYDVMSQSSGSQDWLSINNAIDNLLSIIKAESTLENVSIRLLARNLINIDTENDNDCMTAETSQELVAKVPQSVMELVDRESEEATTENLRNAFKMGKDNWLYRLFHGNDHHYSYNALSTVDAHKISSSDMLSISYENDDPYVVYNTIQILTEEFMKQYNLLRYEQTNGVIAYFEAELERLRKELATKEQDLTDFNTANQIINYEEQTKMVAERSRDLDTRYETVEMSYNGAVELRKEIEEKMGMNTEVFTNNTQFIEKLRQIGSLYASSSKESAAKIEKEAEDLRDITNRISAQQHTKEGMSSSLLIREWLDAVLLETRSKAELEVLDRSRKDISSDFARFSPVGSSLKRQNRDIDFSERAYLSMLEALNDAKLREKNLQLTSATFKVLSPPAIAISPESNKNKLFVIIAFLAMFVFLLVIFIIADIFNRKPYDKSVAERLTGTQVLGAIPTDNGKKDDDVCRMIARNHLGNAVINYFDRTKTNNIVNVFSMEKEEGKSFVCETLDTFFKDVDINSAFISWNKDFDATSKEFLMSWSIYDFAINEDDPEAMMNANVTLVEYPPLSTTSIPTKLLTSAALNVVVVDAGRKWKGMDNILIRQIRRQAGDTPLVVCLNHADKDAVGTFTGMLPPFNSAHSLRFTMFNLGISAEK